MKKLAGARSLTLTLTLTLTLAALACASNGSLRESLADSARSYADALRWGRYDAAIALATPAAAAALRGRIESWGEIVRIVDVAVGEVRMDPDGREATVHVNFDWYRLDENVIHHTRATQRLVRVGQRFGLASETREAGARGLLATRDVR